MASRLPVMPSRPSADPTLRYRWLAACLEGGPFDASADLRVPASLAAVGCFGVLTPPPPTLELLRWLPRALSGSAPELPPSTAWGLVEYARLWMGNTTLVAAVAESAATCMARPREHGGWDPWDPWGFLLADLGFTLRGCLSVGRGCAGLLWTWDPPCRPSRAVAVRGSDRGWRLVRAPDALRVARWELSMAQRAALLHELEKQRPLPWEAHGGSHDGSHRPAPDRALRY